MQRDPRTTISSDARENPCNLSLWQTVVAEVREQVEAEPLLASFLYSTILNHRDLAAAISFHLANKLASDVTPALMLREIFDDAFARQPDIIDAARSDIIATYERDSACLDFSTPLLYFKGFHALTAHRVAHWLWRHGHRNLALVLQNRISVAFGVDIHPAARIGKGILLDHATGVVIGETAVVEDGVSMMQSVTLGGTGKETGDRHPKIRRGVLIGPGPRFSATSKWARAPRSSPRAWCCNRCRPCGRRRRAGAGDRPGGRGTGAQDGPQPRGLQRPVAPRATVIPPRRPAPRECARRRAAP